MPKKFLMRILRLTNEQQHLTICNKSLSLLINKLFGIKDTFDYIRPFLMQMSMLMPNLILKNVKISYLIFDPPMHKYYF